MAGPGLDSDLRTISPSSSPFTVTRDTDLTRLGSDVL